MIGGIDYESFRSRARPDTSLLGTSEVEMSREFVRQGRGVVDENLDVDARYAAVVQQHPERWFTGARLVLGDSGRGKRILCA